MWSQILTWSLSGLWLGLILRCSFLAHRHAHQLKEHEKVLRGIYERQDGKPFIDPIQFLESEGWKATPSLQRQDLVSRWRALTRSHKQKLISYVEMMPQIGLLGTVVSLFLAAFLFDFNMTTLGFALFTTIVGLCGALLTRYYLEIPTEESFFNVIELLENQAVVEYMLTRTDENQGE